MYATKSFKTKKALREAVKDGEKITIFAPGLGTPQINGPEALSGPNFKPHTWYAQVLMKDGYIVKVK